MVTLLSQTLPLILCLAVGCTASHRPDPVITSPEPPDRFVMTPRCPGFGIDWSEAVVSRDASWRNVLRITHARVAQCIWEELARSPASHGNVALTATFADALVSPDVTATSESFSPQLTGCVENAWRSLRVDSIVRQRRRVRYEIHPIAIEVQADVVLEGPGEAPRVATYSRGACPRQVSSPTVESDLGAIAGRTANCHDEIESLPSHDAIFTLSTDGSGRVVAVESAAPALVHCIREATGGLVLAPRQALALRVTTRPRP